MRSLFALILWAVVCQAAPAQKMRDVFASMPDNVLRIMTRNNRLDCIDFIENNMEAKVRNRYDGYSILKTLTDNYLDLQLTTSCRVEMKLLEGTDTAVYVCVARTYSGPATESRLELYKLSDWTTVAESEWKPTLSYSDFWQTNDTVDAKEIERLQHLQDMRFITAALDSSLPRLTFTLLPGEVEKEEAERMADVLQPIVYEWDKRKFVRVP